MKKWSKGKKRIAVLGIVALMWAGWCMLLGNEAALFDPNAVGIVDVIVVDLHGEDDTLRYYNIGTGRVKQVCEPFEAEEMATIQLSPDSLDGPPRKVGHKSYYQLGIIRTYDENGQLRENTDPLLEKMLLQMEKQEHHDIMSLRVLQISGEIFLCTELNVNLWCPYELYWYDQQNDRLVELYTFDGLEVVGMRIRDLERAK